MAAGGHQKCEVAARRQLVLADGRQASSPLLVVHVPPHRGWSPPAGSVGCLVGPWRPSHNSSGRGNSRRGSQLLLFLALSPSFLLISFLFFFFLFLFIFIFWVLFGFGFCLRSWLVCVSCLVFLGPSIHQKEGLPEYSGVFRRIGVFSGVIRVCIQAE